MDCTIHIMKTKALISFAVKAQQICAFVFSYAKSRFSHEKARVMNHPSMLYIMTSFIEIRKIFLTTFLFIIPSTFH